MERGDRGPLSGRSHVNAILEDISDAVSQGRDETLIDLSGYSGMTPVAFDEVIGACREAEQEAGKARGTIVLRGVPTTLRDMHHTIAGTHHSMSVAQEENGDWRLTLR